MAVEKRSHRADADREGGIGKVKLQLDQAQNAGDLARASELRYGQIPELERNSGGEQDKLANFKKTA